MRTTKEDAARLLAQIQRVANARILPMMGEYVVYVDDRVIGQFKSGQLFVKVTQFGEEFASDLEKRSAYEGAKPAFAIPDEKLDDTAWLNEFLVGTVGQLPLPKKK